jgi:hypothetical protein
MQFYGEVGWDSSRMAFTPAQIKELFEWVMAAPPVLNDPAMAPLLVLLTELGVTKQTVDVWIERARVGLDGRTQQEVTQLGLFTRRTGDLGADAGEAMASLQPPWAPKDPNVLPQVVATGRAFQINNETWHSKCSRMVPFISEDGTVVGIWLGGLGYLGDLQGFKQWMPLPQPRGHEASRLWVTLAYLPGDPGRRNRMMPKLLALLRVRNDMTQSPFLPHILELTYTAASPADDQASWRIDPTCPAGRVYIGMQRELVQDALSVSTVLGIGIGNLTVPPLGVTTA